MAACRLLRSIAMKPPRLQGVAEDGDPKQLLLRDHADVGADHLEQHRDVVERLVVAHHEVRLAGQHVVAPDDVELDPGVVHDVARPAVEPPVAHVLGDPARGPRRPPSARQMASVS